MAKPKPKSKTKATGKKPAAKKSANLKTVAGDHARMLPEKRLIRELSTEMDATLERTSTISGTFGRSMKDAVGKGVNQVAFRLAKRLDRMAQRDALKAAVTHEDLTYYLECLDFDKKIAPSMFKAEETRSGKGIKRPKAKASRKKPPTQPEIPGTAGDEVASNVEHLDDHREDDSERDAA